MLHIRTIEQLKECLFSDKTTGFFITPIEEFVKAGHIIKPENRKEYYFDLGNNETLNFQVSENVIVFKGYNIKPEKHFVYHRAGNLPATLFFLKNGELNTSQWFVNGHSVREHPMQPVVVDKSNGGYWTFQYAKTEDGFFEASYVIYDKSGKGKGRVIDMMLRKRGVNINFKEVKRQFPFVEDIEFEDCYDLSKNIFTDDQVTLLRMIDI